MRACYRGPAHRPVTLDHPPQAERLKAGAGGGLTTAINYALYQVGWLACVFGATWSHPWAGVAIGGLTLTTHLMLAEDRGAELRLACLLGVVGACVEGVQMAAGTLSFSPGGLTSWLPPVWIILLWMQFAGTLRYSLQWLTRRLSSAVAFGAIGGPLAYAAVSRLGIVRIESPQRRSLLVLSLLWAVAMGLAASAARGRGPAGAGRYRI